MSVIDVKTEWFTQFHCAVRLTVFVVAMNGCTTVLAEGGAGADVGFRAIDDG